MNNLESAMYWYTLGVATIPIQYRDKRPRADVLPDGKWEPFQTQLPTPDLLLKWFSGPLTNIGLVVGWQQIVVIDFDSVATWGTWLQWANNTGGIARRASEQAYMVKTARGVHVYIRLPHTEYNRKLPGIDIKATRGYVLIPPSMHPSGVPYETYNDGFPFDVGALSDVLPTSLLTQYTELPAAMCAPVPLAASADPWEVVARAGDPSQDLVHQLRDKFRVESFFPGAEYSSSDKRWMVASCPFHDDSHPSFWIDTKRQICACHAGCTPKPLDSINLYARLHGLSNRDAIYALLNAG